MVEPNSNREAQNLDPTVHAMAQLRQGYWTLKFVLINSILLVVAALAAYLEYVAYPGLMTAPLASFGSSGPFGFGESNPVLKISFLTFQINATSATGQQLTGVPSFDFFQAFVYALLIVNIVHYWNMRKR